MIKTIDRYIFKELFWPYIFGIAGFIVVLSIDPLVSAMRNTINQGVEFSIVFKWFCYSITSDMIYTFPMAMLFSSLFVFGRLSKDAEITAIKAGGVPYFRMMWPVMFFAMLSTLLAFWFGESIHPYTTREAKDIHYEKILRFKPVTIQENVYLRDSANRIVYVGRADPNRNELRNVVIDEYRQGFVHRRIIAEKGIYQPNDGSWSFYAGYQYNYNNRGKLLDKQRFARLGIDLNAAIGDFEREEEHPSYRLKELRERIRYRVDRGLSGVSELKIDFHSKFAVPFSCFIFALIGATLGTTSSRSGAFIGFGISIIIIFGYYIVMSIARSYGKNDIISPITAAWLQNFIFLAGCWILINRVKS